MSINLSQMSDMQAESGVLATLFKHPEYINSVNYLQAGFFFNVEHGCLYWCVQKLYNEGITNIDALNLSNAFNSNKAVKKKIEEFNMGDIQEFLELSRYAARDTLDEYRMLANTVVALAYKRDLYKRTIDIQHLCVSDQFDLDEINKEVNEYMDALSTRYVMGDNVTSFGSKARGLWNGICEKRNEDGTVGFPSIIKSFNEYFTFAKGELILITARMKKGKSSYAMMETINLAVFNHVPSLYIDTEMSDERFLQRAIAHITGIEVKRVENGKYNEEEANKIDKALKMIEDAPLYHEYIPSGFNAMKIEALCRQLKNKEGLEFVVYDYIKDDEVTSGYEAFNKLGAICDFFKNKIGGQMDIAVLAMAQLNRQNEVGSSDKIEMYCSTSIRWFEKTPEQVNRDGLKCGNYGASIVLNRNGGSTGENDYIDIMFDGSRMRIKEAERHENSKSLPFSD